MERAQLELNKVEAKTTPANVTLDKEHLSDGERYMYRKLGLKMKAFLLLGETLFFVYQTCMLAFRLFSLHILLVTSKTFR